MTGKSKIGPWRIDGQGMKVVKKKGRRKRRERKFS